MSHIWLINSMPKWFLLTVVLPCEMYPYWKPRKLIYTRCRITRGMVVMVSLQTCSTYFAGIIKSSSCALWNVSFASHSGPCFLSSLKFKDNDDSVLKTPFYFTSLGYAYFLGTLTVCLLLSSTSLKHLFLK